MQQPAWLALAWADLGQREIAGPRGNPRILQYYKDVGFSDVHHDEVAWCAAFVGACLERAGIASTRLLLARSYLTFGQALDAPRVGAIAVLSRDNDPALGHVGFWLGETDDAVFLLGGNQGDAVTVGRFDKSRLLGLRWPLTASGSDTAKPVASAQSYFSAALAHVLEMEGGWSEDPHDPGGPTNRGITLATFAAWKGVPLTATTQQRLRSDLRAIGPDAINAIYRQRYWEPCRAAELPAPLALMHFDAAVNHGVAGAARMLQEALSVAVDGDIGGETLTAARAMASADAIASYAAIRRRKYRALPHFWRFGRGWLARVAKTESRARALVGADAGPSSPATRKGSDIMSDGITAEEITRETQAAPAEPQPPAKWWGESMTILGVIITTLSTVLPVLGPFVGLDISAEMIRQIGAEASKVLQAIGGLAGTLLTVYGRLRATGPLSRRDVLVRL